MSNSSNTDSSIEQDAEQAWTMDLVTAQRVEQEKMTRRAALRKFGFGAGMAAFSLLGVDDFARMVGQRMERVAGDNKVAQHVAKEFQNAGIAMADPGGTPLSTNCGGENAPPQDRGDCCSSAAVADYCTRYHNATDCNTCIDGVYSPKGYCSGYNPPNGTVAQGARVHCSDTAHPAP